MNLVNFYVTDLDTYRLPQEFPFSFAHGDRRTKPGKLKARWEKAFLELDELAGLLDVPFRDLLPLSDLEASDTDWIDEELADALLMVQERKAQAKLAFKVVAEECLGWRGA